LYWKVIHPDYWEYQKRLNNGSINHLQKKSSESEYQLNARCQRSGSLSNIHSTNNNSLKYSRYSVCEFNHKKSSFITNKQRKSTNVTYQKPKTKTKNFYSRQNTPKYSFNQKKYSSSSNTSANSCYNHGQPLHYVTYKRDNNPQRLSSTTTTSNLTRSTNNTSSESAFLVDQNKLIQTLSNNIEPSNRLYRQW